MWTDLGDNCSSDPAPRLDFCRLLGPVLDERKLISQTVTGNWPYQVSPHPHPPQPILFLLVKPEFLKKQGTYAKVICDIESVSKDDQFGLKRARISSKNQINMQK